MKKLKIIFCIVISTLMSANAIAFADENALFEPPTETTPSTEQPATDGETTAPDPNTDPVVSTPESPPTTVPAVGTGKTVKLVLSSINATVDGKTVQLSAPAQTKNGRTYLPMRFLAEQLIGASLGYNSQTKEITLKTSDTTAVITIGSKTASVNGKKLAIEDPPILQNGTTLLPLRFFADQFGLGISYDPAKKEVTVKEKITDLNPPVAAISFPKESFVKGESVTYTDASTDADGDAIIAREFSVASNTSLRISDLQKLTEKLEPGTHSLMYRVQSSKKAWSSWITVPFILEPNKPPIISEMRINKTDLGRGEEFDIIYHQENEPWEMITDALWSYRHESQDPSKSIPQKPTRFFTAGKFIVTLQLKDAAGNLSEIKELEVNIGNRIVQTQLEYLSKSINVINTPLENYYNTEYMDMFRVMNGLTFEDKAGLLIMSDSPENVFNLGVLYRETIPAQRGRLLTYHVNKIEGERGNGAGVVIIVENKDSVPVEFKLEKTGMKGPSPDPHEVGSKVLDTHFSANSPWGTTMIDVGKSAIVYDSREKLQWKQNHLISMLSEFETTGTVTITVAAFGPNTKLENLDLLAPLPRDQHPRGTFSVVERGTTINIPSGELTSIMLGEGDADWVVGTDGITGEITKNKGNYGVEYKITLAPEEETMFFINGRGGAFRGYVGWPNGVNRTVSSYGPHDARFVGKLNAKENTVIRYMLANGSASPVKLAFVPKSHWGKL